MINLATRVVTEVEELHTIPGVTNNGQHVQLADHVLADFTTGGGRASLKLYHPTTTGQTGHIDVTVNYIGDLPPTFHRYGHFKEFTPCEHDGEQDLLWPTGGWCLLKTVLAIEEFLEKRIGFIPALRKELFRALLSNGEPALT